MSNKYKPKLDPIVKEPTKPASKAENRAAILFIHGFGDDGPGLENIVDQFQQAKKLPYALWLLPTAPENRDAMSTAWYMPTALPAMAPPRPELEDDEDEEGMLASLSYLETLLDELQKTHSVPPERIALVGFSQGCAMSLLINLISNRYAGRLAGVVGLMGYLPLGAKRIAELRRERGLTGRHEKEAENQTVAAEGAGAEVPTGHMLLIRGSMDRLIPRRIWNLTLEGLKELDIELDKLQVREYEAVGHAIDIPVLNDTCSFLERILPDRGEAKSEQLSL